MNVVVIIPARGGSKRFPGKNLALLQGKPLLTWSIEAAKKSSLVDRVIVSTDDDEIARVAKEHGADVPFIRPAELARDDSPVIDTMVYTVEKLEKDEGYKADYVILLQAASPLIDTKQIDTAVSLAIDKKADSVVAVSEVDTLNHPYNIREIKEDGTIVFWQDELHYQNVENKQKPKFYKAANLWLSSFETLTSEKKMEGKRNYPLVIDQFYSMDVDYPEDLDSIKIFLEYRQKNNNT